MVGFASRRVAAYFVFTAILTVLVYFLELLFPFFFQAFLSRYDLVNTQIPGRLAFLKSESTSQIIFYIILISFFRSVAQGMTQQLSSSIMQHFKFHHRQQMIDWILFRQRLATGKFLSIFGEVVNSASAMIISVQGVLIHALLCVLFLTSILFISTWITLVSLAFVVLVALALKKIMNYTRIYGNMINKDWDSINKGLVLIFKNVFFIRIYGVASKVKSNMVEALRTYLKSHLWFNTWSAVATYMPQFFGIVVLLSICMFSFKTSYLEKALVLPYLYIFFRLTQAVSSFLRTYTNVLFHWDQSKELYSWWRQNILLPQEKKKSEISKSIELNNPVGWSLKNIDFVYPGAQTNILHNFNFEIEAGKLVVITGKSGRGKSTLLGLLIGELMPQSGEILLRSDTGIHKIAEVKKELYKKLGYVGPENLFFSGTIRENLLFGVADGLAEESIREALKAANCQFLVDDWKRLDDYLSDLGDGLSSGQKQRISLARALLRRPKVLLLDEPTANLDDESQSKFIESIKALKGTMTMILITHRSELLDLADSYIDLDKC